MRVEILAVKELKWELVAISKAQLKEPIFGTKSRMSGTLEREPGTSDRWATMASKDNSDDVKQLKANPKKAQADVTKRVDKTKRLLGEESVDAATIKLKVQKLEKGLVLFEEACEIYKVYAKSDSTNIIYTQ